MKKKEAAGAGKEQRKNKAELCALINNYQERKEGKKRNEGCLLRVRGDFIYWH